MATTDFSPTLGTMSARRPGMLGSALTAVDEEMDLTKRSDGHIDLEVTNKRYDGETWAEITLDHADQFALATFLAHQMDADQREALVSTIQAIR